MAHVVVLGAQWGDEGKGKVVDALAREERFRAVVRYQGGDNAGHTVVVRGERHAFHLLPSGVLYPDKACVIGDGVVVNPRVLSEEIDRLQSRLGRRHARLWISEKAHLIMPWHVQMDRVGGGRIGTTGRGIGPAYADSAARRGIRWGDSRDRDHFAQRVAEEVSWNRHLIAAMVDYHGLSAEERRELRVEQGLDTDRIVSEYWSWLSRVRGDDLVHSSDVSAFLEQTQSEGADILFEGAQATLLDVTHGTYPFVTSSHPTVGGVYIGTGFRPRPLRVLGVAKAYTTRVGEGPFPTELTGEVGEQLRQVGHEFGTTTGRPRRCGWLDLPVLRYARRVNGLDALAVTKLDVLAGLHPLQVAVRYRLESQDVPVFPVAAPGLERLEVVYDELDGWDEDITGVRSFGDLPKPAQDYVLRIEQEVGVPVTLVGVGPEREQLIRRG
jgi:adenylosuccinate synthase